MTGFLINVFEVADPSQARGDTVTARELLARGAVRIRSDLTDQPETQAAMIMALGRVYRQLGLYDEARPLLEDAFDARRHHLEAPHPDIAESLHELGVLLRQTGEAAQAEALLDEALAMDRRLHGEAHGSTAGSLQTLADLFRSQGNDEQAASLYRKARAAYREAFGTDHPLEATVRVELGALLRDRGDYAQAEPLLRAALASLQKTLRPDHERIAHARRELGACLSAIGDYEEAEQHLHESYAIYKSLDHEEDSRRATLKRLVELYEAWGEQGKSVRISHPADRRFQLMTTGRRATPAGSEAYHLFIGTSRNPRGSGYAERRIPRPLHQKNGGLHGGG